MGNYCSVPVLTGTAVSPNILFVIDVSGSMSWSAYNPDTNGRGWCTDTATGCGHYDPNVVYEGYFIPDKIYQYNSNANVWVEAPQGTQAAPCPPSAYGVACNWWWGCFYTFELDTTLAYTGSCLNFLLMSRIDLVRWAITGGMPDSCNGVTDNDCAPELFYAGVDTTNTACDSEGCILGTSFFGHRVKVPWSRIFDALVYKMKEMTIRPRFGVMFYSLPSWSDPPVRNEKVYIGDFLNNNSIDNRFPYKNLIMHINGIDVDGGTPTGPALWDVYNYFAQYAPEYGGFTPQQGTSDKWRNPIYQCIDKNNDGSCQGDEFEKVPCAKNFVILMTDGQWNIGGPPNNIDITCTIDAGFEGHSADPVVPAYWLHARGFTNQVTGDSQRVEAVYTIGLWLGGTGENSLQHVSMYGSFDLSAGTWPGGMSNYPMESGCFIDDCTNYVDNDPNGNDKGSPCTPLPPSSPDWDSDGDGVPDTFYNAKNAKQIRDSIEKIILDILEKVSSGSGVASMSSRSNVASVVLQPSYYPFYVTPNDKKVSWIGLLDSFWLDLDGNFREDTVKNKRLDVDKDPDASGEDRVFFMDYADQLGPHAIFANLDPDASGNNQCQFIEVKSVFDIADVINFACKLAETDHTERRIVFNNGTTSEILSSGQNTVVDQLYTIWQKIDPNITTTDVKCVIDYLRGRDLDGVQECESVTYVQRLKKFNINDLCGKDLETVWKLGDIMNSAPVIVSNTPNNIYHRRYIDETYKEFITSNEYRNRISFAIMGANDGMLHAFRIGYIEENKYCTNDPTKSCRTSTDCGEGGFCVFDPNKPVSIFDSPNSTSTTKVGREEWAFIPYNALPYLLWYGHKEYCHIHTVDYTAMVIDASINGSATSVKTANSWRTLLIGIMGYGGQHIILGDSNNNGQCDQTETGCMEFSSSLFVLDLTDWLNNPDSNMPRLLWEKPLPDKTLTLSYPVVIRRGDKDKNGDWYIVIGTGPKDPKAENFVSQPKIYFFDLRTGDLVNSVSITLPSDVSGAAVGYIKSVDIDNDYQDDLLYFGLYGKKTNNIQWGSLYRFYLISKPGVYKDISAVSSSDISEVIKLSDFCQANYCPTVFAQPETGIDILEDNTPRLWIFFGTGKMLNEDDKLTKKKGYKNYLFGIVDECWNPAGQLNQTTSCPVTYSRSDLMDVTNKKTIVSLDNTQTAKICRCYTSCNPDCTSTCQFEDVYVKVGDPIDYIEDITQQNCQNGKCKGWYIEFTGRVVMSSPVLVETILDVLSYEPPDNICGGLGYTYLTAVNYKSGTPPPKPTMLYVDNVVVTGANQGEIAGGGTGKLIGKGAPAQGKGAIEVSGSPTDPARYEKKIQLSSGVTVKQRQQKRFESGRYILWMER